MKKTVITIMVLAFVLSTAAVAFASPANPFIDVPANNWAYQAVSKLAADGIIKGYPGDIKNFRGDNPITRYEMAQIVARAMAREDQASVEDKALIDKLAVEFQTELNDLGVRVAKLEKNSSSIKIDGSDQERYQQNDSLKYAGFSNNGSRNSENRMQNNVKLTLSGDVNDDISFNGALYFRAQDDYSTNSYFTSSGTVNNEYESDLGFINAYITVKDIMPTTNLLAGRLHVQVTNGLMFGGDYFDGAQLTFGDPKELSGFFGYGDYSLMPGPDKIDPAATTYPTGLKADIAQLKYTFAPGSNIAVGYLASANKAGDTLTNIGTVTNKASGILYKNWDAAVNYQFAPSFTLLGEYTKNNDSSVSAYDSGDKTAWNAGLMYGNADKTKVGTADIYAKYLRRGYLAAPYQAYVDPFNVQFATTTNVEGPNVGLDWTIAKNAIFSLEYYKLNHYTTDTNKDTTNYNDCYSAAVNFWF